MIGVDIFLILFIASVVSGNTLDDLIKDSNTESSKLQDDITNEIANYEVTEIIDDIPNNITLRPIITNYTITKPLNLAPPVTVTVTTDNPTEVTNTTDYTTQMTDDMNTDKETKKHSFSILHIKSEYDRNDKEDYDFDNENVSGIKEYFNSFKKGIVHGFNSIIHRNRFNFSGKFPSIVSGPLYFLNHFRHGHSDVSNRIHKRFEVDD